MIPDAACCPECGADPTEESIVKDHLSDLGYQHRDVRFECPNGHDWQVGIPQGDPERDVWVCPCCDGDFMPHFVTAQLEERELRVRPKCQRCYYVPDDPLVFDLDVKGGAHGSALLKHHAVTGAE